MTEVRNKQNRENDTTDKSNFIQSPHKRILKYGIRKLKMGAASVLLATMLFNAVLPNPSYIVKAYTSVSAARDNNYYGSDMTYERVGNKLVWTVKFNTEKSPQASKGRYFFSLPINVSNFRNWNFNVNYKAGIRDEINWTAQREHWNDYARPFGFAGGARQGNFYPSDWAEAHEGITPYLKNAVKEVDNNQLTDAVNKFRDLSDQKNEDKDFRVWKVFKDVLPNSFKSATITFDSDLPQGADINFEQAMKKVSYIVGYDSDDRNGISSFIRLNMASNEELNVNLNYQNDEQANNGKNSNLTINDYNLGWVNNSVDNRSDIGFKKSPDGKTIYYLYDANNRTQFDYNHVLKKLNAMPNPDTNGRCLYGWEKEKIEIGTAEFRNWIFADKEQNKNWRVPSKIVNHIGDVRIPNTSGSIRLDNEPYEEGTACRVTNILDHYPKKKKRGSSFNENDINQPGRNTQEGPGDVQHVITKVQKILFLDVVNTQKHGGHNVSLADASSSRVNEVAVPAGNGADAFTVKRDGITLTENGQSTTLNCLII